ncbi:ankyrin repeat domain-containing protein [Aspergillus vadensis CBS 113365]|uniref:Ankyrin n=1 Tax=Aspergillus vadensis (strain CBS 113365 / IMI 142717 / IBT 24658) TaxID=1448311 RepID=A0A319CFJ1_ASPVC|nr:ankyrin [Aspergillus vadensis CBS 113365]PYH67112.1 ankyrin [Aspergillus vadensis CBS 113365]
MLLDLPNEILLCIAESFDLSRDILASALCWAAQHDHSPLAERLVREYHANVNAVHDGNTPLLYAASDGSIKVVDALLASRQIQVNWRNAKGHSALWRAARYGYTDIVKRLLKQDNIKLNIADRTQGTTPLAVAVIRGHAETVESLLTIRRVNVNIRDRRGWTPVFHALSRAISYGDRSILEMILTRPNADLLHQDEEGRTPLIYAVQHNEASLTVMLLRHPTSRTEPRDFHGRTALWYAVQQGNTDIIQLLLDSGADIAVLDDYGETPPHKSIKDGNLSTTSLLLRDPTVWAPVFALHAVNNVLPPLCMAADRGSIEMVRLLVECGWYVNEVDVEGRTPLHCAAENGHDPVVQVLLTNEQLDVNARDHRKSTASHEAAWKGYGCTPLWYATRHGHHNVALRLLEESSVIVNAVCRFQTQPEKSTSLHHVVDCGSTQLVQRLLAQTALTPNITDHYGRSPLGSASHAGSLPMVELLLGRSDVQVNAADQNEQPPLWSAALQGHIQVVERLLQCGDIDANQGWGPYLSPLLAAITRGHSDVVMRLLNCVPRLDVNVWIYLGDSALFLAAHQGYTDVVARLLEIWWGRTALWWAVRAGQARIVQRLLEDDWVLIDVMDNDGVDTMHAVSSYYRFDVARLIRTYCSM